MTSAALRVLARLATLAADQRDALEKADRARFAALDADRREAARELAALVTPEDVESAEWPHALGPALAATLSDLERPTAVDDALRAQLDRLRATVVGLGVASSPRFRRVTSVRPMEAGPSVAALDLRR